MSLFNRMISTALSAVAAVLRDPPPVPQRPPAEPAPTQAPKPEPRRRIALCAKCGCEIDATGKPGAIPELCDTCRAAKDAARKRIVRQIQATNRPPQHDNPDGLLTSRDLRARWGMSDEGVRRRLLRFGQDVRTVTYHGLPCHAVTAEEADRIDAVARKEKAAVSSKGGQAFAQKMAAEKAVKAPPIPAPAPAVQPVGAATAAYIQARFNLSQQTIRGRVLDGLLVPIPGTNPGQYTAESVAALERQYAPIKRRVV